MTEKPKRDDTASHLPAVDGNMTEPGDLVSAPHKAKRKRDLPPRARRRSPARPAYTRILLLLIGLVVLAGLALYLLLRQSAPAEPAISTGSTAGAPPLVAECEPPAALLVYTHYDGRQVDLYGFGGGLEEITPLTSSPAQEYLPIWSPDGSMVRVQLLVEETPDEPVRYLAVLDVNAAGTPGELRRLVVLPGPGEGFTEITWSPDSRYLTYARHGSDYLWELVTVGAQRDDAHIPHILATSDYTNPPDWDWSPDGSRIAYTARADGTTTTLTITDPDGSDAVLVHSETTSAASPRPRWSPDGSLLTYQDRTRWPDSEIVIIGPATGEEQHRFAAGRYSWGLGGPRPWSPDGRYLVFYQGEDLALYDVLSGDILPVTVSPGVQDNLYGWSPDGTRLLFSTTVDDQPGIYIYTVGVEGQALLVTPDAPVIHYDAEWSANGLHVYFERFYEDSYDKLLINADGTGQIRLVDHANFSNYNAHWSPDGRWLATVAEDNQTLHLQDLETGEACVLVPDHAGFFAWRPAVAR